MMQELGHRLQLDYRVEYHKLEYEELGRGVYFAQHCNSIQGACVLRDSQGKRVSKAYLGMGTEGQRGDTLSFLFSSQRLDALQFFVMILQEKYRAAPSVAALPNLRVVVNVTADSPRGLAAGK